MPNPLNELGVVKIASPCRVPWSTMKGDDVQRFCAQCKLNVYNLSALDAFAARDLLFKAEGRLCVRFYARADGTVLTKDCPTGVGIKRRRAAMALASAVTLLLGGVTAALQSLGLVSISNGLDRMVNRALMTGTLGELRSYQGAMMPAYQRPPKPPNNRAGFATHDEY